MRDDILDWYKVSQKLILDVESVERELAALKAERTELRLALEAIATGEINDGTPDRILITGMQTIARAVLAKGKPDA